MWRGEPSAMPARCLVIEFEHAPRRQSTETGSNVWEAECQSGIKKEARKTAKNSLQTMARRGSSVGRAADS